MPSRCDFMRGGGGNMSNTENEVVGCVSGIRKRLLCSRIPAPTSDVKPEAKLEEHHSRGLATQKEDVVSVPPGIVARLMGLESLPEQSIGPRYRPIDAFLPRRSADSIYNPAKFDPLVNRQVGMSLSFRDLPTYLQDDVKEFFLCRAEKIWEKKTHDLKERKNEISGKEGKQMVVERTKTKWKEKHLLNQPIRTATISIDSRKENDTRKYITTSQRKIQNHLAAADRITFPKKHTTGRYLLTGDRAEAKLEISAKEISKERCSNMRRKQQLDFSISKFSPRRRTFKEVKSVNNRTQSYDRFTQSMKPVCYLKPKRAACKLAKGDLKRLLSRPREMWKQENIKEIGIEFGASILDGLLHEVVAELWGLHMNYVAYK